MNPITKYFENRGKLDRDLNRADISERRLLGRSFLPWIMVLIMLGIGWFVTANPWVAEVFDKRMRTVELNQMCDQGDKVACEMAKKIWAEGTEGMD